MTGTDARTTGEAVRATGTDLGALLRARADRLEREYRDHDPVAFTRRLAERIAAEDAAGQPPAPGARHPAVRAAARPPERTGRSPAADRPPAADRAPAAERPLSPGPSAVRPSTGRPEARRAGPAAWSAAWSAECRAELRRDLHHLCGAVAAAADPYELALGLDPAGQKGVKRTLACLLYSIGRADDAVFWWRIAAQGGDHLAVHCLAVHYTAEGNDGDAELWRGHARDLAYQDRLPDVALGAARPYDPAAIVRTLTEEFDGGIVLTLREVLAPPRVPLVSPATEARPVRGRTVPPQRRSPLRAR
ncbi:hypothetical protein ACWGB8_35370 [Kitasatospora sp. NPDC054939]